MVVVVVEDRGHMIRSIVIEEGGLVVLLMISVPIVAVSRARALAVSRGIVIRMMVVVAGSEG